MSWLDEIACAGMDTELFFPSPHGRLEGERVRAAKRVCAVCPVQRECLRYALALDVLTGARDGIFGGLTGTERRRLLVGAVA